MMNMILIVFGIIGAILTGTGVILILAHNWNKMGREIRAVISVLPLIGLQILTGWGIWKEKKSVLWRETCALLYFFAIGEGIAMIGQTYHISGDLGKFIFVWMIAAIPLFYIFDSVMVMFFYLIGITSWVFNADYENIAILYYYPMFLVVIPNYYKSLKNEIKGIRTVLMSWIIGIAVVFATIVTLKESDDYIWLIAYVSIFTCMYIIGRNIYEEKENLFKKPFQVIGALGLIVFSGIFIFGKTWSGFDIDMKSKYMIINLIWLGSTYFLNGGLLYKNIKNKKYENILINIAPFIVTISLLKNYGEILYLIYFLLVTILILKNGIKEKNPIKTFLAFILIYEYIIELYKGENTNWYMLLIITVFAIIYLCGKYFEENELKIPSILFKSYGFLGVLISGYILSFREVAKDFEKGFNTRNFFFFIFLLIILGYMYRKFIIEKDYPSLVKASSPLMYLIGILNIGLSLVLMNIYVFIIGVAIIYTGLKNQKIAYSNFGILILAVLFITRFFDTELSFYARGIIFLAIGILFFVVNHILIKSKRGERNENR